MALKLQRLLGAVVVAGCTPEPNPSLDHPEIEWEGDWLRFGRSKNVEPQCAGTAPYMDRYVGALVDIFQFDDDIMVDFFYVDDMTTPCEALGCVEGHAAFSLEPVQEHELVHAVRSHKGFSHLLLEEGAAELWGDDSRAFAFRHDTAGTTLAAAEAAGPDGLPSNHYGVAGRFHSLLLADGPDVGRILLGSTTPRTTTADLSQRLTDSSGLDLQDWDALFQDFAVCEHAEYRNATAACESVPVVERCTDGRDAPIEVHVGCENEYTLGPRDGEIWAYRSIELHETGTYVLGMVPDLEMKGGSVELKQCGGGCGSFVERRDVPTGATPGSAFEAEAGMYLLRFTLPEGESGDFNIRVAGNCPE